MNIENFGIDKGSTLSFKLINNNSKKTIVFLHGVFGQGQDWVEEGYSNEITNYNLVFVDLRGHGGSFKIYDPEKYDPKYNAIDIIQLMNNLTIDKAIIWGYSYGGRMALAMGIHFPQRVEKLIIGGMHPYPVTNVIESVKFRQSIIKQGMKNWVDYLESSKIPISEYTKKTLLQNDHNALVAIDDCIINWSGFSKFENLEETNIVFYLGERDTSYLPKAKKFVEDHPINKQIIVLKGLNHFTAFSESDIVYSEIKSLIEL